MFNDLQVGTTIRFYLEFNDTYTVGVIQNVEESGYKVSVNGIGVSTVFVPFQDILEIIDKNYITSTVSHFVHPLSILNYF
jgi:hypothetical protein